jgi:hypothetical protein
VRAVNSLPSLHYDCIVQAHLNFHSQSPNALNGRRKEATLKRIRCKGQFEKGREREKKFEKENGGRIGKQKIANESV